MKKLFVLAAVAVLSLCSAVKADIAVQNVFGNTRDTSATQVSEWNVKYLGGANSSAGNMTASNESHKWWLKRTYTEGALDMAGYSLAQVVSAATVKSKSWNENLSWISSSASTTSENGYYSYVTTIADTFFGLNENQKLSFNGLSIDFATDDHLHAVVVNGVTYDGFNAQFANHQGWTQSLMNIMLEDIAWNNEGANTIEFIVHNNNSGSNYGTGTNPTGFSAIIQAAYLLETDDMSGKNLSPEPATLLVFGLAGLAGLPISRRIRRK